jgi:soluble lytic murein transglycosylase-like protein
MENVQRVMQRIATIEQRFQRMAPSVPSDFAGQLAKAESAGLRTAAGSSSRQEIANMVQSAAQRHNVDPKLAMAVAVAESDLQPQAVSPAGAVGVMQLMPDTASSLGVRNIADPRENIDGGVRYLKKMLATFDGDVTKAVAAYNAGPEAVARYQGVPPYAETVNYVKRVLNLSN